MVNNNEQPKVNSLGGGPSDTFTNDLKDLKFKTMEYFQIGNKDNKTLIKQSKMNEALPPRELQLILDSSSKSS